MRMQHNIIPPAPGRGGNRKRKREEPETSAQATNDGYSTFKVDPPDNGDFDDRFSPMDMNGEHVNGAGGRRSPSPDLDDDSDPEDGLPAYLLAQIDPNTGLIQGRTPSMVKYIVMKAKEEYALKEHAALIEELRMVRHEEQIWRKRKDALLDEVLKQSFGYVNTPLFTSRSSNLCEWVYRKQAEDLTLQIPSGAGSLLVASPVHRAVSPEIDL